MWVVWKSIDRGVGSGFCVADITTFSDIQEIVDDVEDTLFSKIHNNPRHVLALFLRRSELTYSLRTRRHDMTERYLNDLLDSVTIILPPGSFLKTLSSSIPLYSFTRLLYLYILMYSIHAFLHRIFLLLYCVRLSSLLNE